MQSSLKRSLRVKWFQAVRIVQEVKILRKRDTMLRYAYIAHLIWCHSWWLRMLACNHLLWSMPTSFQYTLIRKFWYFASDTWNTLYLYEGVCRCHENVNRARFWFKSTRSHAEVPVCVRTIQKQANLKIQKIVTIMYHIYIPFVAVLSSFRIPSCCQQTMCLYHCPLPIKRSPQTHTKNMQDSNQSSIELWLPGMDNESSAKWLAIFERKILTRIYEGGSVETKTPWRAPSIIRSTWCADVCKIKCAGKIQYQQ